MFQPIINKDISTLLDYVFNISLVTCEKCPKNINVLIINVLIKEMCLWDGTYFI